MAYQNSYETHINWLYLKLNHRGWKCGGNRKLLDHRHQLYSQFPSTVELFFKGKTHACVYNRIHCITQWAMFAC